MSGLGLRSPVMVASGCGGTGRELAPFTDLDGLAFVTRTLTSGARSGGPTPRLVESPSGFLNAVGLHNPGFTAFCETELRWLVRAGAQVFVSIAGSSLAEYAELARSLGRTPGIAGVEVNLSVPDPEGAGVFDAREPYLAASAISVVRRELPRDLPVLAKLRLDVSRAVETARAVSEAGASAVVLGNALPAAMPDGRSAGLSGPALRPVALRCVLEVVRALPGVAVIGAGGVESSDHARDHLRAGAVAVQVGTALLHDPTTVSRLVSDLAGSPHLVRGSDHRDQHHPRDHRDHRDHQAPDPHDPRERP
ncbi:tRNA-dihydrouridine synthase [Nocardioides sp. 616]|uniref:tRNA-dihydrouridine synthase n=1 Tax=Nocardioides sp. 616 TaxID=2268090 RepID=UPI000CE464A3|nr:tRNA-dihydrouridine synthase [Nocardioides sp. 616]